MNFDLLLRGGDVIDGTGAAARPADVAVQGGHIAAIGNLAGASARASIDCAGRTVVPGFIDVHSHADWLLPDADHGALVEPFVRQGMTTVVAGNCGFSPAPITPRNQRAAKDASHLLHDGSLDPRWATVASYLDALDAGGVSLNVVQLVGHGTVRAAVTGPLATAAPTADELDAMEQLVGEALDAGCAGVSTGLGYAPGIFAAEPELTAFAAMAARRDKLFTSHLKAYSWISGVYSHDPKEDPHNLAAIREILRVAESARARLQISHLIFVGRHTWPSHGAAIRLVEEAAARGLDVGFDAFPYTAGNTTCAVIFPAALLPRLEQVLSNPEELDGLRRFAEMAFGAVGFGLPDIQIMHCGVPSLNQYDGLRIPDAAARAGQEPFEFYARLTVESRRNARVLNHTYSGDRGDEDALRAVLAHPLCTVETDTILTREGHQNPASYGTFPRVLSTYVREGLFTVEEAVRKMTSAAAERLRLRDRGVLRTGAAADLVVLDLARLADRATFERPDASPEGVDHVFVNGRHVLDGDRYDAGARAGAVLRL